MMLSRFAYTPTETEGVLETKAGTVRTLERPWVPGYPGGTPYESCVPDGKYKLVPHARPNGDQVVALVNPKLHVWYTPADRNGNQGRDLILIHVGNSTDDIVGCIAPGLLRTIYSNRRWVGRSRDAMELIMAAYEDGDKTLTIQSACGAK